MSRGSSGQARPQGRPRSERARRAILKAAGELIEIDGYQSVTVEAIAARASVSKATIYRWWPNKAAVVADSFLELTAPQIDFLEADSVREQLRLQMRRLAHVLAGKSGHVIAALIAEAQADPEVAAAFVSHWIAARRRETRLVIDRGVARGELRADLDIEVAMDALYGPIYYRLLVRHLPLSEQFAETLADHVLRGVGVSELH